MSEALDQILNTKSHEELVQLIHNNPRLRARKVVKQIQSEAKHEVKHLRKKISTSTQRIKEIDRFLWPHDAPLKVRMDWLKQHHLSIFQDVFGKQYDNVAMYEDYRELLCTCAALFLIEQNPDVYKSSTVVGGDRARLWRSYGYPHFFVSPQIAEAIEKTDLAGDQKINPFTVSLPYEAFAIIMPKGKTPFRTIHLARDADGLHFNYDERQEREIESDLISVTSEFTIQDAEYPLNLIADWFFKLLYVMHSKPEIIQTGKRIGTAKKTQTEWYEPVVIGAKYQYRAASDSTGATGITRRTHWRRGHFRNQQFGLRAEPKTKVIWIEPILVNA